MDQSTQGQGRSGVYRLIFSWLSSTNELSSFPSLKKETAVGRMQLLGISGDKEMTPLVAAASWIGENHS